MTKRILMSVTILALTITMVVGATTAYFSDKETNNGNTVTAGTLDLLIDNSNSNKVLFNIEKMVPDNETYRSYTLKNNGNVSGFLNITKATVTQFENGLTEPEIEAGDDSEDVGELGKFLQLHLYVDKDKDGYFSTGDELIYRGTFDNMPTEFIINRKLNAGEEIAVRSGVGFYEMKDLDENIAQSDKLVYDLEFVLSQKKLSN